MLAYVGGVSPVHRLHPVTKLAWMAGYVVLGSLWSDPRFLAALLLLMLAVAQSAGVLRAITGYSFAMLSVAAVVFVLQVLFRPEGSVLLSLIPSGVPLVGGWLPITAGGVTFGLAMSLRMLVFVAPVPVLFATTQVRDIARAMVETLHMPREHAFLLATTLRFVPVVTRDVATIAQAQRARGLEIDVWNPWRAARAFVPIALPIVFIAIAKADRLSLSMQLRGYGGARRTYARVLRVRAADMTALALLTVMIAAVALLSPSAVG